MNYRQQLEILKEEGNLRTLPPNYTSNVIDFTSNDYLGLGSNKKLIKEFLEKQKDISFTSSASRLLASTQTDYLELESFLGELYNRSVLLYNSGYHINTGILPALCNGENVLIIADKLIHASLIDGIILSRVDFKRFPHNDLVTLDKIVNKNTEKYRRIIIVTESIFSMDGDSPDLKELLEIKKRYPNVMLYIDEAHAFGVKGNRGLGMTQELKEKHLFDIIVFPLGKAAASMGAFVVCDEIIKQYLVNKSRTLIFSTALPPIQIQWTKLIIEKILTMQNERAYLAQLEELLLKILVKYTQHNHKIKSHIQPLIIGDPRKTIDISRNLMEKGIKVLPIRRPTVPSGSERLRFSLSAKMTYTDLEILENALRTVEF